MGLTSAYCKQSQEPDCGSICSQPVSEMIALLISLPKDVTASSVPGNTHDPAHPLSSALESISGLPSPVRLHNVTCDCH